MKDTIALQLLPYVLLLTVLLASSATGHTAGVLRVDLTHVDSGRGFTKRELLRRMAARSRARIDSRWSPPGRGATAHAVTVPVARGTVGKEDSNSEYLIMFGIGTPNPQRVVLILDTGSDLIWTQCSSCEVCFPQPFPKLYPSSTVYGVSCYDPVCALGGLSLPGCAIGDNICLYTYSYGDNSVTTGKIYKDTFTFQQAPNSKVAAVPNLLFGCGMFNTGNFGSNESGIAGFGRGALSLPSQLKVGRFSHCFTAIVESKPSPVFLGTPDNLEAQATGPIQSTPFVRSPDPTNTHYYLSLKGITVGKTRLPFDASAFALKCDGSGGTVIDSGSAITSIPEAVYRSLVEAFKSQVPLPVNKHNTDDREGLLCFSVSRKKKETAMPKLILHLEGADLDLPRENYVLYTEEDGLCVVVNSAGEGSTRTIIGNFQQQNTHIVYDLDANKLVFVPAR